MIAHKYIRQININYLSVETTHIKISSLFIIRLRIKILTALKC